MEKSLFRPSLHTQTVSKMSTEQHCLTKVLLLLGSSTSSDMNLREIMQQVAHHSLFLLMLN